MKSHEIGGILASPFLKSKLPSHITSLRTSQISPSGILPSGALLRRLAKPGRRLRHVPAEAVSAEEAGAHLRVKNKVVMNLKEQL